MKSLKKLEIKGNEIDKDLYHKFKKALPESIEDFEAYSEDELEYLEDEEKVEQAIGKLDINKK